MFSSQLQELRDVKAATYPHPVLTNTPDNNCRCSTSCQEYSRKSTFQNSPLAAFSHSAATPQKSVNYRTVDRLLGLDSLHKIYLTVLADQPYQKSHATKRKGRQGGGNETVCPEDCARQSILLNLKKKRNSC